jgi:hypothetical protein
MELKVSIDRKLQAFVIMPFDDSFIEIYEQLLRPILEAAGYSVQRGDDVLSQQSIMKDVVKGIDAADLIVADLTGLNANVMYELGLAHALNRPVIHLIQDVDELPFDLKGYRFVQYDIHFARIANARAKLAEIADAAAKGALVFGNPISDFRQSPSVIARLADDVSSSSDTASEKEPPGLLDQMIAVEDGLSELSQLIGGVNERTSAIGADTIKATEALDAAKKDNKLVARLARPVMIRLGDKVALFAVFLKERNARYEALLQSLQTNLEAALTFHAPQDDVERHQLVAFGEVLKGIAQQARASREAIASMAVSFRGVPRLESGFNSATERAAKELDRYAENIDQTASVIERAASVVEERVRTE